MLSSSEKNILMESYKDTPYFAAAVALKGVACVLIIAGIAVIGIVTDANQRSDSGQTLAHHRERASIADARETLAGRRARFESHQGQRREIAGALFSGNVAQASALEPKIDEIVFLTRASD